MKIISIMAVERDRLAPPTAAEIERMDALIADFRKRGVLLDTGGVMDGLLELKMSRNGDRYTITDGPFSEAKEVVGGYALMEVADRDEAIALTREFLDVAGNVTCHLHEVMSPE